MGKYKSKNLYDKLANEVTNKEYDVIVELIETYPSASLSELNLRLSSRITITASYLLNNVVLTKESYLGISKERKEDLKTFKKEILAGNVSRKGAKSVGDVVGVHWYVWLLAICLYDQAEQSPEYALLSKRNQEVFNTVKKRKLDKDILENAVSMVSPEINKDWIAQLIKHMQNTTRTLENVVKTQSGLTLEVFLRTVYDRKLEGPLGEQALNGYVSKEDMLSWLKENKFNDVTRVNLAVNTNVLPSKISKFLLAYAIDIDYYKKEYRLHPASLSYKTKQQLSQESEIIYRRDVLEETFQQLAEYFGETRQSVHRKYKRAKARVV